MSEQAPTTPPIIDMLRAQYPGRNVCSVAVTQLDQPADMARFLIEYAHELGKTSERPETRANPFDTAVMLVDRVATLHGGEIADRWHELIDTGTVRHVPDHSLDWITPKNKRGE